MLHHFKFSRQQMSACRENYQWQMPLSCGGGDVTPSFWSAHKARFTLVVIRQGSIVFCSDRQSIYTPVTTDNGNPDSRVFQDFLSSPFLQRRSSLAEQVGSGAAAGGWFLCSWDAMCKISVTEMQCVKANTINWLKIANALFFLCCEMTSSHFFLIVWFNQLKTNLNTTTRHEFNSNNFIFTALKDWVSKLNSRLSFRVVLRS
jgi:hypothetical protein